MQHCKTGDREFHGCIGSLGTLPSTARLDQSELGLNEDLLYTRESANSAAHCEGKGRLCSSLVWPSFICSQETSFLPRHYARAKLWETFENILTLNIKFNFIFFSKIYRYDFILLQITMPVFAVLFFLERDSNGSQGKETPSSDTWFVLQSTTCWAACVGHPLENFPTLLSWLKVPHATKPVMSQGTRISLILILGRIVPDREARVEVEPKHQRQT